MSYRIGELPDDTALAKKVIEGHTAYETTRMQQGWLGLVFGDVANKSGNVAGFAIVVAFMMMLALMFAPVAAALAEKLFVFFGGVITLALGYMFGKGQH